MPESQVESALFNGSCHYEFENGEWSIVFHCLNGKNCAHPGTATDSFRVPDTGLEFLVKGRPIILFPDRVRVHRDLIREGEIRVSNIEPRDEGDYLVYEKFQERDGGLDVACPEQP